jgi:nitrite reductase (NADH) small subunit
MNWIAIGTITDIPQRGARCVDTPDGKVAVFRTADDRVFAIDDHCPHKGGPLSQGIVHGHAVTCPLHNWVFDLQSGEAAAPDVGCVKRFAVRVEDGRVLLSIPGAAS